MDTGIGKLTDTGVEDAENIAKAIKKVKEIADDAASRDLSAYDNHIGNNDIHVTAAQKTEWSGKQDAISDLATIRSNASGAQKASDSKVAFAEGESGYKITAGNKVGDNLVALDKELKEVADKAKTQADWNQTNTAAVDFIKNKPTVDQTYSATSQNAQSGTAVASAISGINTTATTAVQGVNATVSGSGEAITAVAENSTTHDLDLTKSLLNYNKAMEYKLANYTTGKTAEQFTASDCSAENPCVLTIVGMDRDNRPVYEWTQMAL